MFEQVQNLIESCKARLDAVAKHVPPDAKRVCVAKLVAELSKLQLYLSRVLKLDHYQLKE